MGLRKMLNIIHNPNMMPIRRLEIEILEIPEIPEIPEILEILEILEIWERISTLVMSLPQHLPMSHPGLANRCFKHPFKPNPNRSGIQGQHMTEYSRAVPSRLRLFTLQ